MQESCNVIIKAVKSYIVLKLENRNTAYLFYRIIYFFFQSQPFSNFFLKFKFKEICQRAKSCAKKIFAL